MRTSPVKEPYVNPLKTVRNSLGVTLATAASQVGLSKNVIMGYEAGMYTNPSEQYIEYLLNHPNRHKLVKDINHNTLTGAYVRWRKTMRETNAGILRLDFDLNSYVANEYYTSMHPLAYWRWLSGSDVEGVWIAMPLTTVCKAFCVQQSNLSNFENKPEKWRGVPDVFIQALRDAGYREVTIAQFCTAWKIYSDKRANVSREANGLPVSVVA